MSRSRVPSPSRAGQAVPVRLQREALRLIDAHGSVSVEGLLEAGVRIPGRVSAKRYSYAACGNALRQMARSGVLRSYWAELRGGGPGRRLLYERAPAGDALIGG